MKVCDHLNLLEKDYYGLAIWQTPTMKVSLFVTVHCSRLVFIHFYEFNSTASSLCVDFLKTDE